VRVTFYVHDGRKRICGWHAEVGHRRRVPGSLMGYGNGIPHDLAQYVVEAATGYETGFWGLVARGATFKSTGRKRTKPGRALIARHRAELAEAERLAGGHLATWRAGAHTTVTAVLDQALVQWRQLEPGENIVFDWPKPVGTTTTTEQTTTETSGRPDAAA
jgi:hypothetical protein